MTDSTGFERWEIWVQDTDPSNFTFLNDDGTRADLTDTEVRLSIQNDADAFVLVTGEDDEIVKLDQTDTDTRGIVTVTLSLEQRARLSLVSENRYQIQRVDDALRRSRPFGEIIATKWVNNA